MEVGDKVGVIGTVVGTDDKHTTVEVVRGDGGGRARFALDHSQVEVVDGENSGQKDYYAAREALPDSLNRSLTERVKLVLENLDRESKLAVELRQKLEAVAGTEVASAITGQVTVRAKVTCDLLEGSKVVFRTVYEPDGTKNDENARFTKATPWGTIKLGIGNPAALEAFVLGKSYYVDFTPAE